ncbi:MAG: sigma-70 family RNA polymerase sigma factor [Actinomycetia bacterium]|nr:sigma-70 family RNA polymerase sigma factor [Actinomycetes bacterium]
MVLVGEHAAESSQPCRKGAIHGRITVSGKAYGEISMKRRCSPMGLQTFYPDSDSADEGADDKRAVLGEEDSNLRLLGGRISVQVALGVLNPRERDVIVRRYFGGLTQSTVVNIIGVGQMQVSRIERRALGKLKREMQY